jgi:hypothetical protein
MNNPEQMSKGMTPNLPLWSYQLQQNSNLAVKTRKDLEVHLITRAFKDEVFKRELLTNPKSVLEKELGTKLPEELEINVIEETENTVYMVLPCNPYEGMSEEELKASLGMTYEDVAQWVLEQQRNSLLDEVSSVGLLSKAWKDKAFKQELLCNVNTVLEKEWKKEIPADIEIQIVEETPRAYYILIPRGFDEVSEENDVNFLETFSSIVAVGGVGSPIELGGTRTQQCPQPCFATLP